jgi:hypothetical protein
VQFFSLLPPLYELILEIERGDIRGGQLLNLLHKKCHCGVPELQTCIQRYAFFFSFSMHYIIGLETTTLESVGVAPIVEKMMRTWFRWFEHVERRPLYYVVRRVHRMETRGRERLRETIKKYIRD